MHNKLVALFVCVCLCISLSSCGGGTAEPENTEAPSTETQAVQNAEEKTVSETETQVQAEPFGKFTFKQLCEQNRISVLLKNYDTVSFTQNNSEGKKVKEGCFFLFRDYPVSAECWNHNDEEYYYSFNGSGVEYDGEHYVMDVYAGPEEEKQDYYDSDYDIAMYFDMGPDVIYDVREMGDFYTFSIAEEEKSYSDTLCKVSKYDLSIREITVNYGNNNETVTVFKYNEPVKDYGFSDGWSEHKLREVTVIQELSVNGEIANGFMQVFAPYNVEVKPFSYYDYDLWADGEQTEKYFYPGDDCDYTVHYTNIVS